MLHHSKVQVVIEIQAIESIFSLSYSAITLARGRGIILHLIE